MSTRFGENLVTDLDTITLLTGQNLIVPVGYQITSINTFAVIGTGTHRISVGGSLSGGNAAIRINDGLNTRVTVTATGLLMGDLAGVEIFDTGTSTVVNSGTISSLSGNGVLMDKTASVAVPDAKFILRNFGTITGETGVTTGTGLAAIVNDGLISTTNDTAIQTGGLDDSVINRGRIYGVIALGEGKGVLVNDGLIRGAVNFGSREDTFTNTGTIAGAVNLGAFNDQVSNEGLIRGSVDLGANNDKVTNTGRVTGAIMAGEGDDVIEIDAGLIGSVDLGAGSNRLTNSGRVAGSVTSQGTGINTILNEGGRFAAINLGAGNDTVTNEGGRILSLNLGDGNNTLINTGRIETNVSTGSGNDRFDNSGATGRGQLQVFMGDGDDTFLAGTNIETVEARRGIDTLDFSATSGITVTVGFSNTTNSGSGVARGDTYFGFDIVLGSLTGVNNLSGTADVFSTLTLIGGAAADTLKGFNGDVILRGEGGDDTLGGGNGDDVVNGGDGADDINGGNGDDRLRGDAGNDIIEGGNGVDSINGGSGDDVIQGGNDADTLFGDSGNDTIRGGGNDTLNGGTGTDTLIFGFGDQTVTGGGDADKFNVIFADLKDVLTDFSRSEGDKIDLSAIDANSGVSGNQAFTFIGSAAFSNVAGQLRFATVAGTTAISGDTNGDGTADLIISLTNGASLLATDFVL